jgi:hypothetical protein
VLFLQMYFLALRSARMSLRPSLMLQIGFAAVFPLLAGPAPDDAVHCRQAGSHDAACAAASTMTAPAEPYDRWYSLLASAYPDAMAVDLEGQIYLVGTTFNYLPVTSNAFQPSCVAASSCNFFQTGYLLKLDPTGSRVLYATYLNGVYPYQIAVDAAGYMYVLANHPEPDIDNQVVSFPAPITANAVQTYPGTTITPTLLKVAPTGELVYGTFLGGIQAQTGGALTVDGNGSAIVCGSTADPNLVASPGAYQPQLSRNYDVFVARLSPDGSAYQEFTFLGGDGIDRCSGVQLDGNGNIYLYGDTNSRFFPVTPSAF